MPTRLPLAMLLAAIVALPARSGADTGSPLPTELLPVLQAYLADPAANRQALHRLAADNRGNLPPVFVMLLADLRLRQGNRRAAAKLFQEASARAQDPHTAAMAEVALGWIAIADGDTPAAQVRFDRLANGTTSMRALARFMG